MQGVARVLKHFGEQNLSRHAERTTAQQKKTLRAVMACREESLGTIEYACASCGEVPNVPRSCCNRHCSVCQHQRQQQWLASAKGRLLPCQDFLITFTLPSELRQFALRHPKIVYGAMMKCVAASLREAATNERYVGATETGFTSVLHTWGRDLVYHPHVHVMVPAGGLDASGRWHTEPSSLESHRQSVAAEGTRLQRTSTLNDRSLSQPLHFSAPTESDLILLKFPGCSRGKQMDSTTRINRSSTKAVQIPTH